MITLLISLLVWAAMAGNAVAAGSMFARPAISSELSNGIEGETLPGKQRAAQNPITQLAISEQKINVIIINSYALTTVDQTFVYSGEEEATNKWPAETFYRFPLPAESVVSDFTAWIDNVPVQAQVHPQLPNHSINLKNEQNDAGSGNDSSNTSLGVLSGSDKPLYRNSSLIHPLSRNVDFPNNDKNFLIEVTSATIYEEIRIRMIYLQPVTVSNSAGSFSFPLDESALASIASNNSGNQFHFDLTLHTAGPVSTIKVPGFNTSEILHKKDDHWRVAIGNNAFINEILDGRSVGYDASELRSLCSESSEPAKTNPRATAYPGKQKSILVQWCLKPVIENSPESIVHVQTFQSPEQGNDTLMVTLDPGNDLGRITTGRDWIFVLDTSSSMKDKFSILTKAVESALMNLQATDRFRIIAFNNRAAELTKGWQGTQRTNIRHWIDQLQLTATQGGTTMYPAVELGYSFLDPNRTSAVVLVSDGEANIGTVQKKAFLNLLKRVDLRLFSASLNTEQQRPLFETMAKLSNGRAVIVDRSSELVGQLVEFMRSVTHGALHDIKVEIDGVTVTGLLQGPASTLYYGQQLTMIGQHNHPAENIKSATVTVYGKVAGKERKYSKTYDQQGLNNIGDQGAEIQTMHAYANLQGMFSTIDYLGDDSDYRQKITDLALQESMLTRYTALAMPAAHEQAQAVDTKRPAVFLTTSARQVPNDGTGAAGLLLLLILPGLKFARRILTDYKIIRSR